MAILDPSDEQVIKRAGEAAAEHGETRFRRPAAANQGGDASRQRGPRALDAQVDEAPPPLRVLVADDDPMTRRMVCDELEGAGIEVVGQARNGDEAYQLGVELRPDLVLMDVVMPGTDGIAATKRLIEDAPGTAVIILSVADDDDLGMLAMHVGAVGFLTKDIDVAVLPRVLRGVSSGEAAIKRTLTRKLIGNLQATPTGGIGMRPVRSPLTGREWEILDLLCASYTTEGISVELGLSTETVRSHVKSIFRKLHVHSRQEAIEAAKRLRQPETVPALGGIAESLERRLP
jgi:DNA-binding NarL/FixJ family response regulator